MKSGDRKLSFDLLANDISEEDHYEALLRRSSSDPLHENARIGSFSDSAEKLNRRKRKSKKKKKKKETDHECPLNTNETIEADGRGLSLFESNRFFVDRLDSDRCIYGMQPRICETRVLETVHEHDESEFKSVNSICVSTVELRQRSVNGSSVFDFSGRDQIDEPAAKEENGMVQRKPDGNGSIVKLETAESLDWKQLMKDETNLIQNILKPARR